MFRDDKAAADALADSLRRENAELADGKQELEGENQELERENARLRAELAKSRPRAAAPKTEPSSPSRNPSRAVMWTARVILAGLTTLGSVGLLFAFYEPRYFYPRDISVETQLYAAFFNLIWSQWALPYVIGPRRVPSGVAISIVLAVLLAMIVTCAMCGAR